MTEIKVGDKVVIYELDDDYNEIKTIAEIIQIESYRIKVKLDHLYTATFHRKQCRKLVKMRKCEECNASGRHPFSRFRECTWCDGKGRVKINGQ